MRDAMQDIMPAAREASSAEAYASGLSTLTPDEVLRATCDVEANARDPFGDGDQSFLDMVSVVDRRRPKVDLERQALKNLWCDAGDFFGAFFVAIRACGYQKGVGMTREPETGLSPFMLACALGDVRRARAALAAAHEAGEEAHGVHGQRGAHHNEGVAHPSVRFDELEEAVGQPLAEECDVGLGDPGAAGVAQGHND